MTYGYYLYHNKSVNKPIPRTEFAAKDAMESEYVLLKSVSIKARKP
jgi:hypothetical protein